MVYGTRVVATGVEEDVYGKRVAVLGEIGQESALKLGVARGRGSWVGDGVGEGIQGGEWQGVNGRH